MAYNEIFSPEPRKLIYRPYEDNSPKAGQVLVIAEQAAPKHGTEFTQFRGIDPLFDHSFDENGSRIFMPNEKAKDRPFGMRPGNMWVGRIAEIGPDVKGYAVGERVVGFGALRPTHMVNACDCLRMPERMTWKEAVCLDPAKFAFGGIRDGNIRIGDNVVVFGLGAIGLIAAQMAKLSGAEKVIVVDPIEKRREVAMENGADLALDAVNSDAGWEIKRATDERGADVIVESSGAYTALQSAIRGLAYGGTISVVGWYKECKGGLNLGLEAHFNLPNIVMSRACSEPNRDHPRWSIERIGQACWDMLAQGKLRCENIVDPVVPFEQAADMYMQIEQNPDRSVKMGVVF